MPELQKVLVTVIGPDTPGITAAMSGVVAKNHGRLLDIEQVVVQGQLTLCMLIGVSPETAVGEPVIKDLLFRAKSMGLDLQFKVIESSSDTLPVALAEGALRYAVTAIGDSLDAEGVHILTRELAALGANIESIRKLSGSRLISLEIIVSLPGGDCRAAELRRALLQGLEHSNIDVGVQRERLTRRAKRLIVMDMDSTLIQIEVIDELARMHGVVDRVADITRRAMSGELDFAASLTERVGLLKGLPYAKAIQLAGALPLTQGAPELLTVLRRLGYKTAVISGGFTFAANVLKEDLGLDYAYANELEVEDGLLTGRVVGAIVTPERKAELLREIAEREGIALDQTIAMGDGANDLAMLTAAGLGIAFHAKAKLKAAADTAVSAGGLDRMLYLLGLPWRDVEELLADTPSP
jgi:phosphoserine phosphatase